MRNWFGHFETRSLLSNSIVTFTLRVAAAVCVYLTFILLARFIKTEALGHFVIVQAGLWLSSSLATLGLAASANRFIPAALARGDPAQVSAFIRWSRKTVFLSGLAVGLAATAAVFLFDRNLSSPYSSLVLIGAASVPFSTLITLNGQIARSLDWVVLSSMTSTFLRPFLLLATLVTLHFAFDILPDAELVLLAQLMLLIGLLIVQYTLLRKKLVTLNLPAAESGRQALWLGTSLILLLSQIYFGYYVDIHILVAGLFLASSDLAILNAALRTLSIVAFASAAVGIAFTPKVAQLFEANDPKRLRTAARQAIAFTFWPALFFLMILIPFADHVLALFGPEYVGGRSAMIVAAFAQLALAFSAPLVPMLGMTGHHNDLFWVSLFVAVLVVVTHMILTPAFGIIGSAAALLVCSIAWSAALYVRVSSNLGYGLFHHTRSAK